MTDEFDRGVKEGRDDATLLAHAEHLSRINGHLERAAIASEQVAARLTELASEIRTLQEEGRIATRTASALATETERRRADLADTAATDDRRFSRREKLGGLLFSGLVAAAGIYFRRHITG